MSDSTVKTSNQIDMAIKVATAVLILVILFLVGWYITHHVRRLSSRLICASNLQSAASSLKTYCTDEGDWNKCIATLKAQKWQPIAQVMCPTARAAYEHKLLVVRSDTTKPLSSSNFVLIEPLANHGVGGNVAFADGHARFLDTKDYAALLANMSVNPSADD